MPERWSRDWIILVLFAVFLVAIIANLIYIQVIRGPAYARMAQSSHTTEVSLSARRGTVYDRNGEVIASNVDATTIYVNPQEVTNPDRLATVLAEVLGQDSGKTKEDYVAAANNLANMFSENFAKKYPNMPKNIAEAGPKAK